MLARLEACSNLTAAIVSILANLQMAWPQMSFEA